MSTLQVEKISESFIRIRSEKSTEQELSQYLTFEMPGAKFTPLYKAKRWDGLVRLFNLKTHLLYAGLYDLVCKFAADNNYQIEEVSNEKYPKIKQEISVDREKIEAWVDSLDIHDGNGEPIEVRDYQIDAFINAIQNKRCVLLSPTASGKSLIIYLLVRYFELTNKRMLLVVPSVNLVEQMFNDFNDYAKTQDWKADDNCQMIYAGQTKEITKSLTISTWQSIYEIEDKKFFSQFNVVFGDEAHLFAAKSLTSIMEKLDNARFRIATTGTIDNKSKVNVLTLIGLFGPVFTVSTLKDLMDDGFISVLKTKVLILKHPETVRKVVSKYNYQNEIDYICSDVKRNKFMAKLSIATTGNTLILVNLVENHAIPLREMLEKMVEGTDRKIFGIYGSVSVEPIKKLIKEEDNCIIVASYKKFSTGANVPSIKNIIFGSPSKSTIRVLQSIGRGLRLDDDKTHCNLFDIVDNLSYKSKINTTMRHGTERIKIYEEQKFNYKLLELDL